MRWRQDQIEQFERDGYLFAPRLFSQDEVAELNRAVVEMLDGDEQTDGMHRECERGGAVRQFYLAHRYNPRFNEVSESARIVEPVQQILNVDLYVWHSTQTRRLYISTRPPSVRIFFVKNSHCQSVAA